jgi:hypothetical protein
LEEETARLCNTPTLGTTDLMYRFDVQDVLFDVFMCDRFYIFVMVILKEKYHLIAITLDRTYPILLNGQHLDEFGDPTLRSGG